MGELKHLSLCIFKISIKFESNVQHHSDSLKTRLEWALPLDGLVTDLPVHSPINTCVWPRSGPQGGEGGDWGAWLNAWRCHSDFSFWRDECCFLTTGTSRNSANTLLVFNYLLFACNNSVVFNAWMIRSMTWHHSYDTCHIWQQFISDRNYLKQIKLHLVRLTAAVMYV